MKYRKCEICGLKSGRNGGVKRHFMARYPLDEDRTMTSSNRKGLKKSAVPSLRLKAKPLSDDKLLNFPFHIFKERQSLNKEPMSQDPLTRKPHNDHAYAKQEQEDIEDIEDPHEDTIGDTVQPYSPLSSRAATPAPPSICRCCLAEGCDKDMTSPYQWDGVEEVYGDMLIDTFALEFVAEEPSAALLICDGCIEQLRRASQFKQRTISSAAMFQQHVDELNASRADIPQPATTKRKIDMEVFPRDGNTFDSDSDFSEPVTTKQWNLQIPMDVVDEINRARTANLIYAQTKTTQEETIAMCDECGKVFKGVLVATQLIQHKKLEHDIPQRATTKRKIDMEVFPRDGNTNTFDSDSDFPESVTTEQFDWQIPMEAVDEINRARTAKSIHAQTTQEETIGMCDECGEVFEGVQVATQLIQHKKLEHDIPQPATSKRKIDLEVFSRDGNTNTFDSDSDFPESVTTEQFDWQIPMEAVDEINRARTAKSIHAQTTQEETIGMCDECGEVFEGVQVATQLIQHKKLEHAPPKKKMKIRVKKSNRYDNLLTIVSNSNACPFHWPTEENKRYRCYCCDLDYVELKELRRHFNSNHNMSEFCAEMRKITSKNQPIKLDIADLKCTNCEELCDDLEILRLHLSHMHNIESAVPEKTVALKIESEGYKCLECQHEFEGWQPLIRHILVNGCVPISSNKFECADCWKRFYNKKTLRAHINSTHSKDKIYQKTALRANTKALLEHSNITLFIFDDVRFRCFSCHETFVHFHELMAHSDTHEASSAEAVDSVITPKTLNIKADITDLKCALCQNAFEHIDEFQRHLVESHQVKFLKDGKHYLMPCMVRDGLKCGFCKQSFATSQTLVRHVNSTHVNNGSQICEHCGKSFVFACALRRHKLRVHSEFKCALCNITFENSMARRTHNKRHHYGKGLRRKRPQFRCVICKASNFTSIELKFRHLKEEHGYQSPEYECAVCNKVFCTDRGYKMHIRYHRKLKTTMVPCEKCLNSFLPENLETHIQYSHKEAHTLRCYVCSNTFASPDLLCDHLVDSHSDDASYCPMCGYLPEDIESLLSHLRIDHKLDNKFDSKWVAFKKTR